MIKKFIYGVITLLFAWSGFALASYWANYYLQFSSSLRILGVIVPFTSLSVVIGVWSAPHLVRWVEDGTNKFLALISNLSTVHIIMSIIGLIVGLVIAALLSVAFSEIPYVGPYISLLLSLFLGYVGIIFGYQKSSELFSGLNTMFKKESAVKIVSEEKQFQPKILDTSVIIDGRIDDIYKTGFLEGHLIVPDFVLVELRHIADSGDALKRNRGRRGLDVLNNMRIEFGKKVKIDHTDYPDIPEVDIKLLQLAKDLGGVVVTNDFNLNKVAQFQGVKVLNINQLAGAVKPVLIAGENMFVQIIKEGKEDGQGIGYLDDGTMIVVEDGKPYINQTINTVVTSVLQTTAGKMIFVKPDLKNLYLEY